jgi:hypothetical protein
MLANQARAGTGRQGNPTQFVRSDTIKQSLSDLPNIRARADQGTRDSFGLFPDCY